MLTIGGDLGAMILHVPADQHGREIEISRAGDGHRTHAAVRERRLDDGPIFCVVYDGLPAGEYTIWDGPTTPGGTARVTGGQITEVDWTAQRPVEPAAGGTVLHHGHAHAHDG
jgi:hypothetical protein